MTFGFVDRSSQPLDRCSQPPATRPPAHFCWRPWTVVMGPQDLQVLERVSVRSAMHEPSIPVSTDWRPSRLMVAFPRARPGRRALSSTRALDATTTVTGPRGCARHTSVIARYRISAHTSAEVANAKTTPTRADGRSLVRSRTPQGRVVADMRSWCLLGLVGPWANSPLLRSWSTLFSSHRGFIGRSSAPDLRPR